MSAEENVQIMRRWFQEVWNEGRIETIHELFSPEGVARGQESPEGELHGPAEFEAFVKKIRSAFPDMQLAVEDVFATGDKGVLRWSGVMKHTGDAMGMPGSGRTVRLRGIKGASARAINQLLGRHGPVWQEESFDHVLRSREGLDSKIEYVLQNPVRNGLVNSWQEYRWAWQRADRESALMTVMQLPTPRGT
jgi:hypothetical protein